MSLIKLECPICFNEHNSFKILDCGHHFCSKCVDQLRIVPTLPSAPATILYSSVKPEDGSTSEPPPSMGNSIVRDMECPQCRHITPASSLLKTKFMGTLLCRQCDEEKLVEEFRWCIQCAVAVCSKCFVDKHMSINDEGIMCLHPGCKWDNDFPAAKYCIEQLKREVNGFEDHIKKTQEYAKSYLEGFQEYLCREIEQKMRSSDQIYDTKIAAISEAYGIDDKLIRPAEHSNRNYETLVSDLLKVAKIQISAPETFTETQLKLKCLPYKEMAQVLLGGGVNCSPNQTPSTNVLQTAQNSLGNIPSVCDRECEMDTTNYTPTVITPPSLPLPLPPPPMLPLSQSFSTAPNNELRENVSATNEGNMYPTIPPNELFDATKNNNLLDTDLINRKLANTFIIGANMIRQPSDICYLPNHDILLITDFVGGVFTFTNRTTLQGPMTAKNHYHHYSRLTRLPENLIGSAGAMVNVQIGAVWYYTIVSVRNDKYAEQIKLRGKDQYYCHFPNNRNPTLASSDRSLFCLTPKTLYRFSWPHSNDWTDVHTVSATKPHPHHNGRLGPVLDRPECTIVFLVNSAWQAVDVITFSYPENQVWNVRRIKLESFFPMAVATPMLDPYLTKLDEKGEVLLLADKKQDSVYAWNQTNASCVEWHKFSTKIPQKIIIRNDVMFILTQQKDYTNLRALEMVRL